MPESISITTFFHFPVTPISAPTCQFEGAAFRECNSCRTCLEVATEIKHIGVKKCQSASPWLLQSSSWQCAGKAPGPGMLCPSVNTELPSLADATERIFVTWPWVDFITWPGSSGEPARRLCARIIWSHILLSVNVSYHTKLDKVGFRVIL